jgi:hypothetical protein
MQLQLKQQGKGEDLMPLALLEAFPVGQGLNHFSSCEWAQL